LEDFKLTSYSSDHSISTLASKKIMESEQCSCRLNYNEDIYKEIFSEIRFDALSP